MMMEQYLDGAEVDVDIVLSEGVAVYAEVTDNWPTIEPYFQEVGANCPCVLPPAHQKELVELSIAATLSLGFTCGVFHVESKYTTHGARLIEVNCRMGGMQVRNINLLTWGVDLVEEHLFTVVGLPARPQRAPAPMAAISEMAYNAPRSGRMADLSFIDEWTVRLRCHCYALACCTPAPSSHSARARGLRLSRSTRAWCPRGRWWRRGSW